MALKRLRTPARELALLANVPAASRLVVLRAVNPALAAELEFIEQQPTQALQRVRKLDVDTAIELVRFVTSPATLVALAADGRENVTYYVRLRAKELDVSLDAPVQARKPVDVTTRTERMLAKPQAEIPSAINRMATIDDTVVLAYARTVEANAAWWRSLIDGSMRHTTLSVELLKLVLDRQVLTGKAAFQAVSPRMALSVIASVTGTLNETHLGFLVALGDAGHELPSLSADGVAPDAEHLTEHLPVRTRMLLKVATPAEVQASLARASRLLGNSPSREAVFAYRELASAARTPETAALVANAIVPYRNGFNGFFSGVASSIARELLDYVPEVDRQTRRLLWSFLSSSLLNRLSDESWVDQQDEDWLVAMFADPDENGFDLEACLPNLRSEPEPVLQRFFDRLVTEVPGTARVVLSQTSRLEDWGATRVLSLTAARLGANVQAWKVFSQAVYDWPGLLEDLLEAALAASE